MKLSAQALGGDIAQRLNELNQSRDIKAAYHGFDRANSPIRKYPEYSTATGVVPIQGTDPAARQDALTQVPGFLARFLAN